MSMLRVLRTTQVTLTHTFAVDEVPTDASAGVTVAVTRLDGTGVTSGAASHPGDPGQYTYVLTGGAAGATKQLDYLTVDWTGTVGGAAITVRDIVEVVGGFLYGITRLRAKHSMLANVSRYPTADLVEDRVKIEQSCERICFRAFVPRFARKTLVSTGGAYLAVDPRHREVRRVRSVTVAGVAWGQSLVDAVLSTAEGYLYRVGAVWPVGPIVVEYEHGLDEAPAGIEAAAMLHARYVAGRPNSAIPDRAETYTNEGGAVYRLAVPSGESTGIPDVDGDYARFKAKPRKIAA